MMEAGKFGSFKESTNVMCHFDLSRVKSDSGDERIKTLSSTQQRFNSHCCQDLS